MNKDYNVTVKVRNARILNALAKVDEKAGGKLAKKLGVSYQQMLALINLKIEPVDKHGDWLPSVIKLAELTNTMPVELFSDAQYYWSTFSLLVSRNTRALKSYSWVPFFLGAGFALA